MGESNIDDMVTSYVRDCHAMEESALKMLDSMIETTTDPAILEDLENHRAETMEHERLTKQRVEALGGNVTAMKDLPAIVGAMIKGVADSIRSDKPGKNARDGYVTESLEIAAYQLLEQLAGRAGDEETAEMARVIRADEERMRDRIDSTWSKVIDLTLAERGIEASHQQDSEFLVNADEVG